MLVIGLPNASVSGFTMVSVGLTLAATSPAKRSGKASLEASSVSDAGGRGGAAIGMAPALLASLA